MPGAARIKEEEKKAPHLTCGWRCWRSFPEDTAAISPTCSKRRSREQARTASSYLGNNKHTVMSSSSKNAGPSCGNPYDVLGLPMDATDEAISKAYKRLALKYHPVKRRLQQQKIQQPKNSEEEKMQSRFLAIIEARNFLLNEEFSERRKEYDNFLKSQLVRRREEDKRERQMSAKRQQLRAELQVKEFTLKDKTEKHRQQYRVEKLRTEGRKLREQHAAMSFAAGADQQSGNSLLSRQVRLKWSRRSNNQEIFRSEALLKHFLSTKFGAVSRVEFVGSKNNAALVTFNETKSVEKCINSLTQSKEMRAYRIEDLNVGGCISPSDFIIGSFVTQPPAVESFHDRRLRQNEEREKLCRNLGEEEVNDLESGGNSASRVGSATYAPISSSSNTLSINGDSVMGGYPPPLAVLLTHDERRMIPLDRLEKMEQMVLPRCVASANS